MLLTTKDNVENVFLGQDKHILSADSLMVGGGILHLFLCFYCKIRSDNKW
jgi:hypothetical protein